jgi:hypothetical protein
MAENPLNYGRPQPGQQGDGRPTGWALEAKRDSRRLKAIASCVALVFCASLGVVGFLAGRRSRSAENLASPGQPAPEEARKSDLAVHAGEVEPQQALPVPMKSSTPGAPVSPGVILGFDDIERACGDLASYRSYLCLVNRGSESVAGGARLAVTEDLASFGIYSPYNNGISINVQGKERYSLDFGPPKGKALIRGLYTGAVRWPFNEGPYPGIDVNIGSSGCSETDGRFRILEFDQAGDGKISRFVADFESTCNGAIGRVAVGKDR